MTESSDDHRDGPWVDNHCHIELERGDDGAYAAMLRGGNPDPSHAAAIVEQAREAGVVAMVTVGTDAASSQRSIDLARALDGVWATAGVHPHDATEGTDGLRRVLDRAAGDDALVAIGECGLDHHYDHSPREVQRAVFAEQIALAHELDLPLVIHTREAWEETFAILDSETVPPRTVFHCFTGGPEEAEGCLARGALLSISGIVTFKTADALRDAVRLAPLDRLMVETDSPYLAPVPHRGRPNTPAYVGLVGAEVARVHDVPVQKVAEVTTANASAFYGIDPP